MSFRSALYPGAVFHHRLRPRPHRLRYRVFSALFDLDELPGLGRSLRLFGYNRRAVFSFHDADHGDGQSGGLRRWVDARLGEAGLAASARVEVLCYPRIFGYVFNPLTVFFCYGADAGLTAILYEVCNTHGERHTYVIPVAAGSTGAIEQTCQKRFFVSPFIGMDCSYRFRIAPPAKKALVSISEDDKDGPLLSAVFSGRRLPLGDAALLQMLVSYPMMTLKVMAGIHFEALRLWLKGAPVFPHRRAEHAVAATIVAPQPVPPKLP